MGEIVQRAWGTYEVLIKGGRYKVKRLVMNPGATFSHQYHHHRSEVWTIVQGCAEIILLGVTERFYENATIIIPLGADHKLTNIGKVWLEIIEVHYGSYLEEDDIVRLEEQNVAG